MTIGCADKIITSYMRMCAKCEILEDYGCERIFVVVKDTVEIYHATLYSLSFDTYIETVTTQHI